MKINNRGWPQAIVSRQFFFRRYQANVADFHTQIALKFIVAVKKSW